MSFFLFILCVPCQNAKDKYKVRLFDYVKINRLWLADYERWGTWKDPPLGDTRGMQQGSVEAPKLRLKLARNISWTVEHGWRQMGIWMRATATVIKSQVFCWQTTSG